ncbi:MAG: FAD-binding oxidoreductase [Aestuariivirga sp.]
MSKIPTNIIERLVAVVGEKHAIRDAADMVPYLKEWRDLWRGTSQLILRPSNTAEVSAIMKICNETKTPIIPQSGNTGLVGGQIPMKGEVVLSLDRMTRIIEVDAANDTMTVEAGAILKSVHEAADMVDRMFPLSLASEGSCRIGGNLSTNAGGLNVLAYGTARELCLGLEVVLPSGEIWNGLKKLRKDNTGYNLKELFLGSEGTLGIITAAVLKLYPKHRRQDTAIVGLSNVDNAVSLLSLAKSKSGNRVVAFELLSAIGVGFAVKHMNAVNPVATPCAWYVLIELADAGETALQDILEQALGDGLVLDAAIASSDTQRNAMWHVRESMSESQKFEGGSIKHDVSVPVSSVPQLIERGSAAVLKFMPGARPVPFGHIGDGNIHFNISQPIGMDKQAYLDQWAAMNKVIFDIVLELGGSISAEHGIGVLKRNDMAHIKTPLELQMMRGLKAQFDPNGILSPGRMLPDG